MADHSLALIIPPIVGLVTYCLVLLFRKIVRDSAGVKTRLANIAILQAPKNECTASIGSRRPPQREARPQRRPAHRERRDASHQWGTVTLLTVGATCGFAIVWYLLNNQSLVVTLKHLAAF